MSRRTRENSLLAGTEQQSQAVFDRAGSQSQHRICFILPTHRASHRIKYVLPGGQGYKLILNIFYVAYFGLQIKTCYTCFFTLPHLKDNQLLLTLYV